MTEYVATVYIDTQDILQAMAMVMAVADDAPQRVTSIEVRQS